VRKLLIVNSIETDKAGIKLSSKFLISTLMISQLGINRCPILGDFGKKGCGIELAVLATAPTWEWGCKASTEDIFWLSGKRNFADLRGKLTLRM
jgi:hypothetical protein